MKYSETDQREGKFIDGLGQVKEMLREADPEFRETLLRNLAARDPRLAQELRGNYLNFEEILLLEDGDLRKVLGTVDIAILALACRALNPLSLERIMRNLTQQRIADVKYSLEYGNKQPLSQVKRARQEICQLAQNLEKAGQISFR